MDSIIENNDIDRELSNLSNRFRYRKKCTTFIRNEYNDCTCNLYFKIPCKFDLLDSTNIFSNKNNESKENIKYNNWWSLIINARNPLNECVTEMKFITCLHLSDNKLTILPESIKNMRYICLLNLKKNLLIKLPDSIGHLIDLQYLDISNNLIATLPYQLGRCYKLEYFKYEENPLSEKIKTILTNDKSNKPIKNLLLNLLSQDPNCLKEHSIYTKRHWIHHNSSDKCCSNFKFEFSVFSYNILCDSYCNENIYGHCHPIFLDLRYRCKLIFQEINTFFPDIVALQEVSIDNYENLFVPFMSSLGYYGVLDLKSRSKNRSGASFYRTDGCATFYRNNKFILKLHHLIEFNELASRMSYGSTDMLNRVMTKDNIASLIVLGPINHSGKLPKDILFVNTHLFWDPAFSDVKNIQTFMLCEELSKFSRQMIYERCIVDPQFKNLPEKDKFSTLNIILCGDLNSFPCSPSLELLLTGYMSCAHSDFVDKSYKEFLHNYSNKYINNNESSKYLQSSFLFKQTHDIAPMEFTAWSPDFAGVIDYILYSGSSINCVGTLEGPKMFDLINYNDICALPNYCFPSDHIYIVSKFELCLSCNF